TLSPCLAPAPGAAAPRSRGTPTDKTDGPAPREGATGCTRTLERGRWRPGGTVPRPRSSGPGRPVRPAPALRPPGLGPGVHAGGGHAGHDLVGRHPVPLHPDGAGQGEGAPLPGAHAGAPGAGLAAPRATDRPQP